MPSVLEQCMSNGEVSPSCPYCDTPMAVTRMACPRCRVQVEAQFPASRLGALPVEHQRFIELFVLAGGSLKEIAEQTGVSYPTVRSRLDKVIAALAAELDRTAGDKAQELTPQQKAQLIKNI
jgi:hypothetical protein